MSNKSIENGESCWGHSEKWDRNWTEGKTEGEKIYFRDWNSVTDSDPRIGSNRAPILIIIASMLPTYATGANAMNGFIIFEYSGCDDNNWNIIDVPNECPIYPIDSERLVRSFIV